MKTALMIAMAAILAGCSQANPREHARIVEELKQLKQREADCTPANNCPPEASIYMVQEQVDLEQQAWRTDNANPKNHPFQLTPASQAILAGAPVVVTVSP